MEGVLYRRDLLSAEELLKLSRRSNRPGVQFLLVHLFGIVCGGLLVAATLGSWWIIPAWFIYGVVLVFLFAPLHECIHGTAFRSSKLNKICAAIFGFVILLPANYFRYFHFAHHRYTNDPEKDPELQSKKPVTKLQYIWYLTGLGSYWWPQLVTMFKHCFGVVREPFVPESAVQKVTSEARLHVAFYFVFGLLSVLTQNAVLLIFWVIPIFFGMIVLRLFLLAEHAQCELSSNMLSNTRTTKSNILVRRLAWNMPFHCEHHVFPSVPFHQLPSLHQHLKHRIENVSSGYGRFHLDYIRTL